MSEPESRERFCWRHLARDCNCNLWVRFPDAPRDPRPWWERFKSALGHPYISTGRCGKYRRPYGLWSLVMWVLREGPRPRTFGRWWADWRGDVATRKAWRKVRRMPPGPERDEAWSRQFRLTVGAAKATLEGAMEEHRRVNEIGE